MGLFGRNERAAEPVEAEAEAELRRAAEALGMPVQAPPGWPPPAAEAPAAPAPDPAASEPQAAGPGWADLSQPDEQDPGPPVRRRVRKSPPAAAGARRPSG